MPKSKLIHHDVYKFNPDAPNMDQGWIVNTGLVIEYDLLNKPASSHSEQFWRKGYVDSLGYRFTPDDAKHVLVTHTNEYGNEWNEYFIPNTDEELVRKYVNAHCGDDCAFIILDDSVKIHTT